MCSVHRIFSSWALALSSIYIASPAHSAISFSIEPSQAQPNQTITIQAIYINDSTEEVTWAPPSELNLYWNTSLGQQQPGTAVIEDTSSTRQVPVNGFAVAKWQSTIPATAQGIQTVAIEGSPQLLALSITPAHSTLADTKTDLDLIEPTPALDTPTTHVGTSLSAFEQVRNALSVYEPMYFILGSRPEANARFQLSFKYRLASPPTPETSRFYHHFYLGYTQRALWDLSDDSIPFIDTTYNPSLFWYKEKLWESAQNPFYIGLNAGIEHASNGKSGESSRSLNDIYLQPELNYTFGNGSSLRFMPRIKQYVGVSSDNPDYRDYMGIINWRLRWQQANGLSIMGSYQQGKHGRQTHQVDIAWPLKRTPLNLNGYLYAQYFNGYGETLLHYSQRSQSQFRIGLALTP